MGAAPAARVGRLSVQTTRSISTWHRGSPVADSQATSTFGDKALCRPHRHAVEEDEQRAGTVRSHHRIGFAARPAGMPASGGEPYGAAHEGCGLFRIHGIGSIVAPGSTGPRGGARGSSCGGRRGARGTRPRARSGRAASRSMCQPPSPAGSRPRATRRSRHDSSAREHRGSGEEGGEPPLGLARSAVQLEPAQRLDPGRPDERDDA